MKLLLDYDEELHAAWVTRALHLAMNYRDADVGTEVRDAMRAMKAHFEGRPASMPVQNIVADEMTAVADRYAHRLAMYLELVLMQQDNDNSAHTRWWNEAMQCLGEYRSAMSQIHERESPTWMGEPKL